MLRRTMSPLVWCAVLVSTILAASDSVAQTSGWWQTAWAYQVPLTVKNNSASTLVAHYSVKAIVNTSALIGAQQMAANCADLRVVYFDGTIFTELDRVVNSCNTTATEVWFALQRSISGSSSDTGYFIYYGNSVAPAPLSNGMNVFLFYEDWENGPTHWLTAGGLDSSASGTMGTTVASTDAALSITHSEKFTVKSYGGDAYSGFIPVTPGTRYSISVWGMSAAASYLPVGFDPYDVNKTKGNETWFWTSAWTLTPVWTQRTANFTTNSTTAFLKLKSEWWGNSTGNSPVYLDNVALRYSMTSEPTVTLGTAVSGLPSPTVSNVSATTPVTLGNATTVSASANANGNPSLTQLVLQVLTPETLNINMSLLSGDGTSGTWQAQFTPARGGTYTYSVAAYSGNVVVAQSGVQTFSVVDTQPPVVSLLSVLDPIQANSIQTLVVEATDNGAVAGVSVTIDGSAHAMTANGSSYSYSWRVLNIGSAPYQVVATDTSGNSTSLSGSFTVQGQQVGVCTWHGCKQGAESFSVDDTINSCRTELETAGFRGTYYVIGTAPQAWFADYSAAGHEIAAHTVDHPCVAPCCSPNCTAQSLAACPYAITDVTAYRQAELEPNIAMIERSTNKPAVSIAWPCGCVDPGHELAASSYFVGARGYYDSFANLTWINTINTAEPSDWFNLWSAINAEYNATIYNPTPIDMAASQGGWAIVSTHGDCTEVPYMGQMSNVLWAAPIGDVLKYIKVRDAAGFSNYNRTTDAITFDAVHNLPTFQRQKVDGTYFLPVVYDNAVTLMVLLQDTDAVSSVLVDDVSVPFSFTTANGARYVTFDASLLNTRHVTVGVTLKPDFTVSAQPPSQTVIAGNAASWTLSMAAINNYSGTATLSVSGLPNNTNYSFSANPLSASQPGTLNVTTGPDTPIGSYTVTVTATDGSLVHSTSTALNVAAPALLQSASLSPTVLLAGSTSTGTVTLTGAAPSGGALVTLSSANSSVATVPASVLIAEGSTSATFTITTSVVTSSTPVTITASYAGQTQQATLTVNPVAALSSITLNPTSLFGGSASTATVTLTAPAPSGGAVVALSSGNSVVAATPTSVTVAEGATSATAMISTVPVTTSTPVTITATYSGQAQQTSLTVNPVTLVSVTLNPNSVFGGASSTGTVTLVAGAPVGGLAVSLSSSNASIATVPASVTVPQGATTANFALSTTPVGSLNSVTITAQLNGSSQSATFSVQPLLVQSISVSPTSLFGGAAATGTITLNGTAPVATVVSLSSDNASATVPASVSIPQGAKTATFTATTGTVSSTTVATVTAQLNSSSQNATLTIKPVLVQSVALSPTSLFGGANVTGTVTLNTAAISATVISLSSNNASATVPASVTIPQGATSATFTTTTSVVSSTITVTITAQLSSSSQNASMVLNPLLVQAVSLSPNSVQGGAGSTGTVMLNGVVPSGSAVVALSSTSVSATVPATLTIPSGSSSANFSISTTAVNSLTSATISAQLNGASQSAALAILPPPNSAWWQPQWLYRLPLTVKNGSTSASLPSRYSVKITFNTAALITAQQLLPNCDDLRIVYFDGTTYKELDRIVNSCNNASTEVWFALQRSIAASGSDTAYYLYYDNAVAGAAPGNGMNVFVFYEDWESGSAHWINAGGLDSTASGTMGTTQISTDYAYADAGTHSEKFTVMSYGGDAFSGFIPVSPSTRYSVSVRGMSATTANMPVGFDPYTSTKTKGTETWFWTSAWSLTPQWVQRSATFTTSSTTAFIKLKSEWWGAGPGTAPVYLDDLVLRLSVTTEPTVTAGASQTAPN